MEYTWLSISAYCDPVHYHRVLTEVIFPVVSQRQRDRLLGSWFFEFNYNGGPNIVTPMLVQNSNLHQTVENIADDIKLRFCDANLHYPPRLITLEDLYKPFPVNSLQFGVYSVKNLFDHPDIGLKQIISEVFIEAVCEEPIQDESSLCFCLYLLFAAIREALVRNPELVRDLFSGQSDLINLDEEACKDLDNLVNEIGEDIDHLTDFHRKSLWFVKWENACQSKHAYTAPLKVFQLVAQLLQMSPQMAEIVIYSTRKYITLTIGGGRRLT